MVIDKERIRTLNDELRYGNKKRTILITSGVVALGAELQREAFAALASFDAFDTDNDPHGGTTSAR